MSSSNSVLGFVGSAGLPDGRFRTIYILHYFPQECCWKVIGTIGSSTPTSLCAIPHRNLLFATSNRHERGRVSSYVVGSIFLQSNIIESSKKTDSAHPFHMCLDSSHVYVIHPQSVNGFEIREDGSVGDKFKLDMCHLILVADPKVPVAIFIPPNFDLYTQSIQRVFPIDSAKDLGNAHIYIRFLVKVCSAADKVTSTDLRYLDTRNSCYLTYIIDSLSSTVSVFYSKQDESAQLQRFKAYPEEWDGTSFISDSLAPLERSFLYVANCGHNSVATFRVLTDGTLKLFAVTCLPGRHRPQHLHYAKDFLYVATDDAIFIYKVEMKDAKTFGNISHINTIGPIPNPTCMVFV